MQGLSLLRTCCYQPSPHALANLQPANSSCKHQTVFHANSSCNTPRQQPTYSSNKRKAPTCTAPCPALTASRCCKPSSPTDTPSSPTCRGFHHQAACTLPSPADSRLHQLQLLLVHVFSTNGHCLAIYSHAKGKPRGSFFGWQRKKDS